jgi:hypothetical protein
MINQTELTQLAQLDAQLAATSDKLSKIKADAGNYYDLQDQLATTQAEIDKRTTLAYIDGKQADTKALLKTVAELETKAQAYAPSVPANEELSRQLALLQRQRAAIQSKINRQVQDSEVALFEQGEQEYLKAVALLFQSMVKMQAAIRVYSMFGANGNDLNLSHRVSQLGYLNPLNIPRLPPKPQRDIEADQLALKILTDLEGMGIDATTQKQTVDDHLNFLLNPTGGSFTHYERGSISDWMSASIKPSNMGFGRV